jgi:superoxide oxidase
MDTIASESLRAELTLAKVRRPPFDSVSIRVHWATVLLVLAMFTSAWLRSQSQDDAFKAILLQIHRSLGVTIWVLTAFRLVWRLRSARMPQFPATWSNVHRAWVYLSEYGLYALLLVQPMTGLGASILSGRPFALFLWQVPQDIFQNKMAAATFHLVHELGAAALGTLAAGHAAAALFHYVVLRDDVLQCMAPIITATERDQKFPSGRVARERSSER